MIWSISCHLRGRGAVVKGNVCCGAEGIAALTDGYECGAEATMVDNVAHSALVGLMYDQRCPTCNLRHLLGSSSDGAGREGLSTRSGYTLGSNTRGTCYELSRWQIHSTSLFGVRSGLLGIPGLKHTGSFGASTIFRNFTLVDTGVGFHFTGTGPDSTLHDRSRPDQFWKVVGATVLASNERCRQYGFVTGHFWNVIKPWGPGTVTDTIVRQSPSLYGATFLEDSYFDGFGGTTPTAYAYEPHLQIACSTGDRNLAISTDIRSRGDTKAGQETGGDAYTTLNMDTSNTLFVSGLSFGSAVEDASRYILQPPEPSYIGDGGCAQIDCDGRRNALIVDEDGSLLGSPGTAIAQNEVRWDAPLSYVDPMGFQTAAELVPQSLRIGEDGTPLEPSEYYHTPGLWGNNGSSCTWSDAHGAHECMGGLHRQLIVEDLTHHSMEHRIGPVALLVDGYLSLATGPQNYAMSGYVETTERLSTFWLTGVLGKLHEVHFSSTVPKRLRLHLRDATVDQHMLVRVNYGGVPNRVDVYRHGRMVAAASSSEAVNSSADHGTSFHDVDECELTVLLRGTEPLDLIVAPIVTLGIGLVVNEVSFYGTGSMGLVSNLAALLGLPPSSIKIPGGAGSGRRRRLQEGSLGGANTSQVTVIIEGGAPTTLPAPEAESDASSLELELLKQGYAEEMQAVASNLSTAVATGDLSQLVISATGSEPIGFNVSAEVLSIPGWYGAASSYAGGDGCDCGQGVYDPDCDVSPAPVMGCAELPIIQLTGSGMESGNEALEVDIDIDDIDFELDLFESGENETSVEVQETPTLTATRTCTARAMQANLSTGVASIAYGVCDYTLQHWNGSGTEYDAGDGVCNCGRGLWDPDCDGVDFTSPELNASSFGCPAGERYLCYKETRSCFTQTTGGFPLGLCATGFRSRDPEALPCTLPYLATCPSAADPEFWGSAPALAAA